MPTQPAGTKVPGVGKVKPTTIFIGVGVLGVAGYLIYKHLTKPAATTTGTSAYGAYGYHGYGYGYVPPTGYGYGTNAPYGSYGFGGGTPYYGYQGYGGTGGTGTGPPTTNAQWGQQVEAALGSNGHDSIAAALGKYLTGSTITQTQYQTVQEGIAVAGYPPVQGTSGYPPQAHVTKGGGGGGNITVPNVVGMETDAAMRALQAAGLNGSHPTLRGGVGSVVTAESPKAGTKVKSGTTIKLTIREK